MGKRPGNKDWHMEFTAENLKDVHSYSSRARLAGYFSPPLQGWAGRRAMESRTGLYAKDLADKIFPWVPRTCVQTPLHPLFRDDTKAQCASSLCGMVASCLAPGDSSQLFYLRVMGTLCWENAKTLADSCTKGR